VVEGHAVAFGELTLTVEPVDLSLIEFLRDDAGAASRR
jgi:hypothetical protein